MDGNKEHRKVVFKKWKRKKVEFHANRVNAELCVFARQKKASTSDQSKNRMAAQKYVECGSGKKLV